MSNYMKRIVYSTNLNFTHMINDRPELVDKSCAIPHSHTSRLKITVPISDDEFLDFKKVKKATETVMDRLRGKNITEEFGIGQTEEFVVWVAKEIEKNLKRKVDVFIQETEKYGMEYVSNQ